MKLDYNISWKTIGHVLVKRDLEQQLALGRISHAYLFSGDKGLGKSTLAQEFAAQILKTDNVFAHPDFKFISVNDETGVEQTRTIIFELAGRPFLGSYKVIIVDNADKLNVQSANSLLKTLEEPTPSTVLILISASKNLLPTVVSRCHLINFSPLTTGELESIAEIYGWETTEQLLLQSEGSAERLSNLVTNKAGAASTAQRVTVLYEAFEGSTDKKILAVNQLADLEVPDLEEAITALLYFARKSLSANPTLVVLLAGCLTALAGLKSNFNKKLVLQKLLIH